MIATRTALRATVLLAAVGMLVACSGPADVAGKTYTSTTVSGHELAEGSHLTLAFTEDSVGAQPGCNSFSAPATWDDGTLRLSAEMRATQMACLPELMDQDVWFTDLLAAEPTLALDGEALTVTDGETTVTLTESS